MNTADSPEHALSCRRRVADRSEVLSPSGADGGAAEPPAGCRCGAGPHPESSDRCERGHLLPGNLTAAVVGQRGLQFWREHAAARREIQAAVIADAGADPDDASEALRIAADSVAQARLIQAAAYQRLVEAGGPLTSAGRTRRAFNVWLKASDRLERYLRMVGLERRSKAPLSLAEHIRQRQAEGATERSTE